MGDIGAIATILKGSPSLADLQSKGYSQYQAPTAPSLNMGAYGPNQAAQSQAAQINMGQANQFLGGQQGLVNQLQAQANGSGPSLAQAQLRQGTEANLSGQLAAAASQRGNQNAGGSQYALGNQAASANQQAAGQSATLRSQEQLGAESGLGQALGAYGGQQIGLAENQAGMQQQTNMANQNATNTMAEFNTNSAQAGNAAQQAQYQFGTNIAAQQQTNQNAAVTGQQLSAQNAQQTALGSLGSSANSVGGAIAQAAGGGGSAKGALITHPVARILGEHSKPEVVVPLDGKMDPHAFLAAMMAKQAAGGGTTPGGPVDHATLEQALAAAAKDLHGRVSKLEKKRRA
jgi:hypothetical protein